MIRQLVPVETSLTTEALVAWCARRPAATSPFTEDRMALAVQVGRRLAADPTARRVPALQALAFWMRRGEIFRLRDEFTRETSSGIINVPRGTVLHFPPTNVDTLFVYSWLLAMLAGNRNLVRLSSRAGADATVLVRVINAALANHGGPLADETVMCTYGHDEGITTALSAQCDVRVIWGGDASVAAIRRIPLAPRSIELAFPDRFSFAVFRADAVVAMDAPSLEELADRFYNDTYWFDQLGCSSPRVVAWVGTDDATTDASTRFWTTVRARIVARAYRVDVGTALAKWTYAYRTVLDGAADRFQWAANELAVVTLRGLEMMPREHPGGGTVLEIRIPVLDALIPVLTSRDQTLAHYGFRLEELQAFVRQAGARSFDRVVPVGEALQFGKVWDGFDLLGQFTRQVVLGSNI